MKIHVKKKAYRLAIKQLAKAGYANNENGQMVKRNFLKESSMRRDYSPQGLA